MRWIYSTNAKDIAVMYLIFSIFAALVGTVFSLLIRTEMATSGTQLINNGNIYNVIIAAHGLVMIFFFIMPSLFGSFGNYFVPVYVGALDTAFPRINNFAFWLLPPSIILLLLSAFIEFGPGVGWTVGNKLSYVFYIYIYIYISIIYIINIARCGKLLYSEMNTNIINYIVKISSTWGQSAWIINNSSETKCNDYSFKKKIKFKGTIIYFIPWLVGITDSKGIFYFNKDNNGIWFFSFKISQNIYNIRLLYFIKKMIGVGKITISNGNCFYHIQNQKNIIKYILPIFDSYSLITNKYFYYKVFRDAILINNDNTLSINDKDILLSNLKDIQIPVNYISPIWTIVNNCVNSIDDAISIISKSWLVGFIEVEGNFYINNKYIHGFNIKYNLDNNIVLIAISYILNLNFITYKDYSIIETYDINNIRYISEYFNNTMKGMKSLEFQIWKRSFNKRNRGFKYLSKVKYCIDKLKNKNLFNLI